MSDALLLVLAFAAALAGMASLALVNDQHWRQLRIARPQTRRLRAAHRGAGTAFLAVSLILCAASDPLSMAVLVWPMLLGVAAALVAAFLTIRARQGVAEEQGQARRR